MISNPEEMSITTNIPMMYHRETTGKKQKGSKNIMFLTLLTLFYHAKPVGSSVFLHLCTFLELGPVMLLVQ